MFISSTPQVDIFKLADLCRIEAGAAVEPADCVDKIIQDRHTQSGPGDSQSINQSINQLINQLINQSINPSNNPSIHQLIDQSINPLVHQSIYPPIH